MIYSLNIRNMPKKAAGFIMYRQLNDKSPVEFLLLHARYGGHWTPPKGHLNRNENDLEAAIRETYEESGYKESDFEIMPDFHFDLQYKVGESMKTVVYWLAKLKDFKQPVKLSEEHIEFKWLQLEEACKLCGFPDLNQKLNNAHTFIQNLQ